MFWSRASAVLVCGTVNAVHICCTFPSRHMCSTWRGAEWQRQPRAQPSSRRCQRPSTRVASHSVRRAKGSQPAAACCSTWIRPACQPPSHSASEICRCACVYHVPYALYPLSYTLYPTYIAEGIRWFCVVDLQTPPPRCHSLGWRRRMLAVTRDSVHECILHMSPTLGSRQSVP